MVWEQRVCVIVMTTRTVERGRTKCGQYWPLQPSTVLGGRNTNPTVNLIEIILIII